MNPEEFLALPVIERVRHYAAEARRLRGEGGAEAYAGRVRLIHAALRRLWATQGPNAITEAETVILRTALAEAGVELDRTSVYASWIFPGVPASQPGKKRRTHCFNCKRPLGLNPAPECEKCGWYICECGACRCTAKNPFHLRFRFSGDGEKF